MRTLHYWFDSGSDSLFAHVDLPETRSTRGLMIVPPFGWEDICAYRPLRFLARALADRGIPVLRYDLPGTGDSSGGALDSGLVDRWIQSIGDAAAELRGIAEVDEIAVLGIRLGGLLAAAAASRGADVQDLILWGAGSSGRNEMRELRAYAEMERWEYSSDAAPPQPVPGFEVGGFLIAPETQRDLEGLDVGKMSGLGGRRVLTLTRDGLAADAKLVRAFESAGCEVRREAGAGYASMMSVPHEALPPESTSAIIADFLETSKTVHTVEPARIEPEFSIGHSARETVYPIGDSMFGILAEPVESVEPECCVLFLNAGGVRHIGPNRMWVEAARRRATNGIASLRFDLAGVGESDGEACLDIPALYQERLVEQVEAAMDALRSSHGFTRFAAVGLCAGAFWAFHAAQRNREICSAILLNPRLYFWDPEVDRRRMVRRGAQGLVRPADWWRLLRGGVRAVDLKRAAQLALTKSKESITAAFSRPQIPPKKMAEAWKKIERNGTRVKLVFTEGEPLLAEIENERQMPPPNSRVHLTRIPRSGHTFRPQWAQKTVNEIIDREIEMFASAKRPARVLKAT